MSDFVGKTLNVFTKKGVTKETIIKELKTKGVVRTQEGNEYATDAIRRKGRGIFFGTDKTVKPAGTKEEGGAVAKAGRQADAVVADELEGKKVDGSAVTRILRSKGIVILENGVRLELSGIVRKGRGYVYAEPEVLGNEEEDEELPEINIAAVRHQKIRVDGKLQAVVTTFSKSGRIITNKGAEFLIGEVFLNEKGEFVYNSEPVQEEDEDEDEAVVVKKAVKEARQPAAPVTVKELKGKNVTIDGVSEVVKSVFSSSGNVVTEEGTKINVADIVRKGRGYVYLSSAPQKPAVSAKRGSAIPTNKKAPELSSGPVDVNAFDTETAADIRDIVEEAARAAVAKHYNVNFANSIVVTNADFISVGVYFASLDVSDKEIAAHIKKVHENNGLEADDIIEVTNEDEDEDEAYETDLENLGDDELEEEEDETETDLEEEEDEDEDETFEEEEVETQFPTDSSELVETSTVALQKVFPGKNLSTYVAEWFSSQEAFDQIGYDVIPGVTTLLHGDNEYVLVGLKGDAVIVLNTETGKMLKDASFATLARLNVAE